MGPFRVHGAQPGRPGVRLTWPAPRVHPPGVSLQEAGLSPLQEALALLVGEPGFSTVEALTWWTEPAPAFQHPGETS